MLTKKTPTASSQTPVAAAETVAKEAVAVGGLIAVTGATGFLGQHLLRVLEQQGHKVRALTRRPQNTGGTVDWVEGDLDTPQALAKLCNGASVLIHMAGLVKALDRGIFFDANVTGTRNILEAAAVTGVRHVIHVSSLTAREPRLSHYAASKAAAELTVKSNKWPFTATIVRPPAIYGPGDMEILKLLKAGKFGILPAPASSRNRFSMIHGEDMARAISFLIDGSHAGEVVEVDDGKPGGYRMSDVAKALAACTEKPALVLTIPKFILMFMAAVNGLFARLMQRPTIFTYAKAREISFPDWTVRASRRPRLKSWQPHYTLSGGLKNTTEWYRQNGFL